MISDSLFLSLSLSLPFTLGLLCFDWEKMGLKRSFSFLVWTQPHTHALYVDFYRLNRRDEEGTYNRENFFWNSDAITFLVQSPAKTVNSNLLQENTLLFYFFQFLIFMHKRKVFSQALSVIIALINLMINSSFKAQFRFALPTRI